MLPLESARSHASLPCLTALPPHPHAASTIKQFRATRKVLQYSTQVATGMRRSSAQSLQCAYPHHLLAKLPVPPLLLSSIPCCTVTVFSSHLSLLPHDNGTKPLRRPCSHFTKGTRTCLEGRVGKYKSHHIAFTGSSVRFHVRMRCAQNGKATSTAHIRARRTPGIWV